MDRPRSRLEDAVLELPHRIVSASQLEQHERLDEHGLPEGPNHIGPL